MREKRRIYYLVGILSLFLAFTGLCGGTAFAGENNKNAHWTQKSIRKVPPIKMYEPYLLELFGQTDRDVPYNYEEAVKLAGHSCGATAGAWEIARIALEELYDPDETPVRGEIRVYAPGAETDGHVGVFGEVITFITGAAPHTGFLGSVFAKADPVYNRRDLMIYGETLQSLGWIFERMGWVEDDGNEIWEVVDRVGVRYAAGLIKPDKKDDRYIDVENGFKIADGTATEEQVADFIDWWNERVEFVFENADTHPSLFTVYKPSYPYDPYSPPTP